MATLEELKKEIAREKLLKSSRTDYENIDKEKKRLENELKKLKSERKYGKYKPIISGAKSAFNRLAQETRNMQKIQLRRERQGGLFG